MTDSRNRIGVFILAKNEAANIARSLEALSASGWPVHVLDSGSTDETESIVRSFSCARFRAYEYTNHCAAYNEISTQLGTEHEYVMVLDADMIASQQLQEEVERHICEEQGAASWAAFEAEIEMCVDGIPLKHASLCPPKVIVWSTGRPIFVSTGHAEKLTESVSVQRLKSKLRHDDRKSYGSFLQSQYRYASSLIERYSSGEVSSRDKLRVKWPLLVFAVPIVSLLLKRGFLDGRAGLVYALDRLIAEAIMYRQAVAARMAHSTNERR